MIDGTTLDDLLMLPLDRFCNRIVEWVRSRTKPEQFDAWIFEIETPPIDAEVDEIAEMERFRKTMAQI